MSIDFGLKLQNKVLYDENSVPDFDIISPDNIEHANNIGKIICNNGIKNVAVVPAIHKTTVRVQVLGYTVFDATYVPKYVYNKIPTMLYNKLKFIHPIYQKIDQYQSLSFLFEITGPSYNVINRLKKDINRKNMLSEFYNLSTNVKPIILKNISLNLEKHKNKINRLKIIDKDKILYDKNILQPKLLDNYTYSIDCDIVYHGMLAYNIYYYNYKKIINNIENLPDDIKEEKFISIKPKISINDGYMETEICENIPLIFINNNNNIDNIFPEYKIKKKIEGVLDTIPNFISINSNEYNIQLYDLFGKMLSVTHLTLYNHTIFLSNYNYLLSNFLFNYYMEDDDDIKNCYHCYYISLITMVKNINSLYNENKISEQELRLFDISLNTLGFNNISENMFYYTKNFNNLVTSNKNLTELPPKNYLTYPSCEIKKIYNNEDSPYYKKFQKEIKSTNFYNEYIKEKIM